MAAPNPSARLAYEELATPQQMAVDCRAAGRNLGLGLHQGVAEAAVAPAPSIRADDLRREVAQREVRVSGAAARLATALHLHLD